MAWRDSLTGLEYLRRASDLSQRGLTLDLHAYQCHVFLDWRELYSTQEKPWDRLADQLNGRGVPNLEDALVNLELQPVHDALRCCWTQAWCASSPILPSIRATVAVGTNTKIEAERTEFFNEAWARCESFMRVAQTTYRSLIGGVGNLAGGLPAKPGLLGAAFRARLRAAMRIPAVEALFPAPWSTAARRMLPSPSPQLTATAMWGPVLAWCVLELLAESIDAEKPEPVALDLFDRLRLREPFAQVFAALGFEGEEAWRVAARIKVGLLTGAGAGQPEESAPAKDTDDANRAESSVVQPAASEQVSTDRAEIQAEPSEVSAHDHANRAENPASSPEASGHDSEDTDRAETHAEPSKVSEHDYANRAEIPVGSVQASGHDFSRAASASNSPRALAPEEESQPIPFLPALWLDPDVRWLTGVHQAEGSEYLVRESYEELLWWLLMPSLLRLAGETAPSRMAVGAMSKSIDDALAAAETAGYRVDLLMAPTSEKPTPIEPQTETAVEPETGAAVEPTAELVTKEPAAELSPEGAGGFSHRLEPKEQTPALAAEKPILQTPSEAPNPFSAAEVKPDAETDAESTEKPAKRQAIARLGKDRQTSKARPFDRKVSAPSDDASCFPAPIHQCHKPL